MLSVRRPLLAGTLAALIAVISVLPTTSIGQAMQAAQPQATQPSIYLMTEGSLQMEMTAYGTTPVSASEMARLTTVVHQALAATAKYKNIAVAEADGFRTAPDLEVSTQGMHYFNPQSLTDIETGTFDATNPPFLVYNRINGKMVLSGLMYYMSPRTPLSTLASIFPSTLASWHRHINLCVMGGTSLLNGTSILPIHTQDACEAKGGTFIARTGWMVHIWLGRPIGRSLFAMDRD